MRINVKDLRVGDIIKKTDDSDKVFKVMEISKMPLFSLDFEKIYPIMCDCFYPEYGKSIGYLMLDNSIEEVELIYRENEEKYESWTSVIPKEEK